MSTIDIEVTIQPRASGSPDLRTPIVPRLSRLMALAIKLDDMVTRREVNDFAGIARLGYVTRARLTQIMNLLLLAPSIQEEILTLRRLPTEPVITERELRPITRILSWNAQRVEWERLKSRPGRRRPVSKERHA